MSPWAAARFCTVTRPAVRVAHRGKSAARTARSAVERAGDTLHDAAWPDMFDSLQAAYAELAESRSELERRTGEIDETRELFEQVIDSMSEALFLLDTRGRVVRINAAAAALLATGAEEIAGRPFQEVWDEPRIPTTPWELLERAPDGTLADIDVEVRRPGKPPVPTSVSCALVRSKTGRIAGLIVVVRDITERKQIEQTVTLLSDASRALAESLDYETTLTSVAHVAVPRLADWCIVYALEPDGSIRRATVAYANPSDAPLAEAISSGSGVDPDAQEGVPKVIRSGTPELYPDASAVVLAADVREREQIQPLLEQVGPVSWMCVPLVARTQTLGAISFVTAASGRRYDEVDLAKAEELARRAAVALDNARLYELERGVAETLQRSLLPQRLPDVPGISVAARYLPARPQAVGGDWYDVFDLADGKVGLVMGDVAGHGVAAAAVMGRLRNSLRAYALEGHSPAQVAERLNSLMYEDEMVTLAYAIFDPATWTLRFVNAAHPPPLVIGPDGSARYLEGGSPPLASLLVPLYREWSVTLEPGSTVLLYTDGLVEVRGQSIDDGFARLEEVATATAGAPLEEMLESLLARVLPGPAPADDVALLAMRASPLDLDRFELRLDATPIVLSRMRRALRHWLVAAGADEAEVDDILVACGEACANAVEHAYGPSDGEFIVEGSLRGGEVVITVRDQGRWRPPRGVQRGRGTGLMHSLMDDVSIDHHAAGTSVVMKRGLQSVVAS